MALLDGDRFEGQVPDGVHTADVADLMRRMVKEQLVKFDGKPLFPERLAYTVPTRFPTEEAELYDAVTDYVREEFNRAEQLETMAAREHRVRADGAAAAAGVVAGGDLSVAGATARAVGEAAGRSADRQAGGMRGCCGPRHESDAMLDDIDEAPATDFEANGRRTGRTRRRRR